MRRLLVLVLAAAPAAALAVPPDFSRGGIVFAVQGGYGVWKLDRGLLASQVDPGDPGGGDMFVDDARNGLAASLRLGYNILGHATVSADFTATGWSIFESSRGGAGWLVGAASWHPLELLLRGKRRPVDASIFFGMGYGIAGQRRGMDGLAYQVGATGEYYFAPGFFVGLYARWIILAWTNFYLSFDQRREPGMTIVLPQGTGGSFFTVGLTLGFRFVP